MEEERLKQQIAYYRARASEYDQWFFRQGRYDRGSDLNEAWFSEIEQVRTGLQQVGGHGDVLELAGGTGIWTELLAKRARSLTVVDSSPEVIAINQTKVNRQDVRYIQANLFEWKPARRYDLVFFGYWLSHVPPDRFASFWETVRSALAPGGTVFLVDSLFEHSSTAKDHVLGDSSDTVVTRRLNDGSEYQIYKVFYRAEDLGAKLSELGWETDLRETEHYCLYGTCRLSE